ncbi:MAG: UDP-N-acetylglucosamine--N-acetylmuramyl-(pentapeptide) pyrophosphoryl-undecaprenol N-acetylglucosamine transferase, partial [Planctomycetota bacterium]
MSRSDANPLSGHGRVGTHRHAPVRPRGPQQAPRTRRSSETQGKPAHRRTGRRVEARRFAARRMLFCGGGTGGHLYPGIEVARELAELAPGSTIVFAGTGREAEVRALEETPFEHRVLSAPRLPQGLGSTLSFPWKAAAAYRQARRLLSEVNPNAVVGLGGYASFPPAIAAVRMGIPLVLLEQNAVPGRVTRMMAHHAREVLSP